MVSQGLPAPDKEFNYIFCISTTDASIIILRGGCVNLQGWVSQTRKKITFSGIEWGGGIISMLLSVEGLLYFGCCMKR